MSEEDQRAVEAIRKAVALLNDTVRSIEQTSPATPNRARMTITQVEAERHSLCLAARLEYQRRARRYTYSFGSLMGEPAWDILLDLFILWGEGRVARIKDACIASRCAETTALRYISTLENAKLVERFQSDGDRRVVNLKLSQMGVMDIGNYLAAHQPSCRKALSEQMHPWNSDAGGLGRSEAPPV